MLVSLVPVRVLDSRILKMFHAIIFVVFLRTPSKICWMVICFHSIVVQSTVLAFWGLPVECFANQPMNFSYYAFFINARHYD